MRLSVSKKLGIYFIALIALATFLVSYYSYSKTKEALMKRTFDQLTSVRVEKKNRIESFFAQRQKEVSNLINMEDLQVIFKSLQTTPSPFDPQLEERFNHYLKAYLEASLVYDKLILMKGEQIFTYPFHQADQTHFQLAPASLYNHLKDFQAQLLQSEAVLLKEFKSEDDLKKERLVIGVRVGQANQADQGCLLLEIAMDAINQIMFDTNRYNGLGESGEAYLVGDDYLMRSSSRFHENSVYNTKVNTTGVNEAFAGHTATKVIQDYRNVSVLSAYDKVDLAGLNWVILAEIDTGEAMIPIYSIRSDIQYLSLVMILLFLGVVILLSTLITSPIKRLQKAVENIAKGEYGQTITYKVSDEIGDLVQTFNHMTLILKEQNKKLALEKSRRLQSMIDGQEMERQRLSRELHDGLAQSVLAIKMRLERAEYAPAEKVNSILKETGELFTHALSEIRTISNGLMPAILSEFGLLKALNQLCLQSSKSSEINIRFEQQVPHLHLTKKAETYLYRITQEALNNIIKHAKAQQAEVLLLENKSRIRLCINDDGQGFSNQITEMKTGNGIVNMKERAELLQGHFNLTSKPGEGTYICVEIPKEY